MKTNWESIIANAQKLLQEDNSWIERYQEHVDAMQSNFDFIIQKKKLFRQWNPLYFYINTSKAKEAKNTLTLDVRYMGQTVATLKCHDGSVFINTTDYDDKNNRDFTCPCGSPPVIPNIKPDTPGADWTSPEAAAFRKYFKQCKPKRNNIKKSNAEHDVESQLLTEFSKKRGPKYICGIQPVKIGEIRFAVPTSFSASKHGELKLVKKGGGIDILARVGNSGHVRICAIEVKDENVEKEPPQAALQQAIKYAVFIRELLRSEAGLGWYKLFGFSRELPKKLTICAACAMPSREPNEPDDTSFQDLRLSIGNDFI